MGVSEYILGRLPVYKGPYIFGNWYKQLWRVTFLGSEFQAKRDGYLGVPATVSSTYQVTINDKDWDVISNGTDAYLASTICQKVLVINESKWNAITADEEAFATFCKQHANWCIDVVEDDVEIKDPEPENPTPDDPDTPVVPDNPPVGKNTFFIDGNSAMAIGTVNDEKLRITGSVSGDRIIVYGNITNQ